MEHIRENIARIRAQMEQAALACGRDPAEILLCAATKMNDAAAVKAAVAAGVDCCGENRVQELQEKQPQGAYDGKPVHFIGHLQTNKVKQVVGKVDLIQSVDRLDLLNCIEKQAAKLDIVQDILLEVNIGDEESKSGFTPEEVIRSGFSSPAVGFPWWEITNTAPGTKKQRPCSSPAGSASPMERK